MRKLAALLIAAASVLSACQQPSRDEIVVFAAASLNTVLPDIAPEADYSFDGSAGLVDQLVAGASADVLVTADQKTMDRAVAAGLIEDTPVAFATNHLVLIVPRGNPGGIAGFNQSLHDKKLVVCAPEVPCGAATKQLAQRNGVELRPVSEEVKVTDVFGKVASGEADAGVVYATDAINKEKIEVFEIPGAHEEPNTYWVAVVAGSARREIAEGYVQKLSQAKEELARYGFGHVT